MTQRGGSFPRNSSITWQPEEKAGRRLGGGPSGRRCRNEAETRASLQRRGCTVRHCPEAEMPRRERTKGGAFSASDASGQCSVSRRPCKRRGGRERSSLAPPLADARRLASPCPRPFIPMSRGAPAERGKRARVTSARAWRTFQRDSGTSARHELLLWAATSAAQGPTWPAAFASQRSGSGKEPPP